VGAASGGYRSRDRARRIDARDHPELGDNLAFKLELASGDVERAFKEADAVLSETSPWGATRA